MQKDRKKCCKVGVIGLSNCYCMVTTFSCKTLSSYSASGA